MKYTVSKLAKIAGISVRTLHFYDEVGILKPIRSSKNGYRYYTDKELNLLQQILFFRELEFSLGQIKEILNSKSYKERDALLEQRKLLEIKKERLDKLIATINRSLDLPREKIDKEPEVLYDSFSKEKYESYKREARERWGQTDAYKQSVERTKNWTKKDYKAVEQKGKEIVLKIVENREKGVTSPEVQEQIEKHFQQIQIFYDCSYQMYSQLGQMYVDDPRFYAHYEKFSPGLAVFMRDSIEYFCEQKREN